MKTHSGEKSNKCNQCIAMWYFIFKNPVIGIWVQSRHTSIFRYTAGVCQSDRWGSKLDRTLQIVIPNNFGQDQKGPTKWTREPRQCQGGHWQGGRQLLHTRCHQKTASSDRAAAPAQNSMFSLWIRRWYYCRYNGEQGQGSCIYFWQSLKVFTKGKYKRGN